MPTPTATDGRPLTGAANGASAAALGLAPGSPLVPVEDSGRRVIAKFFRALGDPTRLLLLEFLLGGERSVSECVQHVGLTQSRVSSHLACLADCGYVGARRDGRFSRYQVTDPRVIELVSLARALAADNAAELVGCMRIDT